MRSRAHIALVALALAGCGAPTPGTPGPGEEPFLPVIGRLPTGNVLDPAGSSMPVGSLPLAMEISPDGRHAVLLLNGWREQGVQVVDRFTGQVMQTVPQAAAFLGLTFSPDGRSLWTSGGNQDVVYRYEWAAGRATLRDSVVLAVKQPNRSGTRYPAGIAFSPDGRRLYVAENLADSLAVVDVASGRVLARHATDRYPYGVAAAPDGTVYVSAWGDWTVSIFRFAEDGVATEAAKVEVGRHPSALLLNADGSRLFIASGSTDRVLVMDTRTRAVVAELLDPPPQGPAEGSTPNALALSPDGKRLFVAEADNNAVAVFDLAAGQLIGRIPVEWYPTALAVRGDSVLVANGKGRGTAPNREFPQPPKARAPGEPSYTMGQLSGTLSTVVAAHAGAAELAPLTARVARANGWEGRAQRPADYPPIQHVIYIIKENRTYDQMLGDIPSGDGDTALAIFPRPVSPNHHALVERFGLFDRFFVNAEASPDGHNWSMAAYTTDYLQKTVPSNYSSRGRTYDWEGTNRGRIPADEGEDDANEPAMGYLWDLAEDAGITFRNFGEFVVPDYVDPNDHMPTGYKGNKPFLAANTSHAYPGFNMDIPDQRRADIWLAELEGFVRAGEMPRFQILRLPNDHTAAGKAAAPTPRAYVADNDLALGRIVEALSRTPFWESTAAFVLEDDAQSGPDHVDSHRSVLMVISPWSQRGVHHRWTNTTDVLATMTEILGIGSLSQFDFHGRPLRGIWTEKPDLSPYTALRPAQSLDERNPAGGEDAEASEALDLRFEDSGQDDLFNDILWRMLKGPEVPYPGPSRMSALEWKRGG
jgi:YVTN family beta-propeller protein